MTRRSWLVTALVVVLGGAFAVSASSTWRGGTAHNLADIALPGLVLVLEVGSITGASLYVITTSTGTRVRAGLLVAIATGVAATFGVQAYGFLVGLPVAAVLLLMVDIIGRFWHESEPVVEAAVESTTVDHEPVERPDEFDREPSPVVDNRVDIGRAWDLRAAGGPVARSTVDPAPEPETEEAAAVRLITEGRTTERQLLAALADAGHPAATRYRVKRYLGNATTRRLEAAG